MVGFVAGKLLIVRKLRSCILIYGDSVLFCFSHKRFVSCQIVLFHPMRRGDIINGVIFNLFDN
jgi:hypothetical protein